MMIQTYDGSFVDAKKIVEYEIEQDDEFFRISLVSDENYLFIYEREFATKEDAAKKLSELVHKVVFSDAKILYFNDVYQSKKERTLTIKKTSDYTITLYHDNKIFDSLAFETGFDAKLAYKLLKKIGCVDSKEE